MFLNIVCSYEALARLTFPFSLQCCSSKQVTQILRGTVVAALSNFVSFALQWTTFVMLFEPFTCSVLKKVPLTSCIDTRISNVSYRVIHFDHLNHDLSLSIMSSTTFQICTNLKDPHNCGCIAAEMSLGNVDGSTLCVTTIPHGTIY